MVFSSVIFLFLFLPALFFCYFLIPKKFRTARNMVLLVFSLSFYAYGEPKYIVVMIVSIFVNYVCGYLARPADPKASRGKRYPVVAAVVLNLLILIYFKYTHFILDNITLATGATFAIGRIVMPIGISFFTFQGMSYVFDVYKNEAPAQKNPLNVMLYISLFPQLIAGPIVRYETVALEITKRDENLPEFADGIGRFVFGLSKKILLANTMGKAADLIFATPAPELTTLLSWIGALAYTFQIYFDFSGYSDMAIGLGRMFGFHFLENFHYPYIARSITDFWRRWHISLSTWFRDYVYIPLGGNRGGSVKQIRNILIVWALTGIWHGAAWNFLFWGLYFAVILVLEKQFLLKRLQKSGRVFPHVYAMLLVVFGWVLFRSPSLSYVADFSKSMLFMAAGGLYSPTDFYFLHEYGAAFFLSAVCSLPLGSLAGRILRSERAGEIAFYPLKSALALGLFFLSVLYLVNSTFNPFIYFRF